MLVSVINPWRACAARVTILGPLVCLSVCLSVTTFFATTPNETEEQYQKVECYTGLVLIVAIFVEVLRLRIISRKQSEKAILQISTGLWSACSVYLEGTRSHNEGHISTPACYLLLSLAHVRPSASYVLAGDHKRILIAQPLN